MLHRKDSLRAARIFGPIIRAARTIAAVTVMLRRPQTAIGTEQGGRLARHPTPLHTHPLAWQQLEGQPYHIQEVTREVLRTSSPAHLRRILAGDQEYPGAVRET